MMTQYKKEFPFPILFPPGVPKNVLAEWLSVKAVPQYHVAGKNKQERLQFAAIPHYYSYYATTNPT